MNKGLTKVMILEHDSVLNIKLRTLTHQHQSNTGIEISPNFSCLLYQTQKKYTNTKKVYKKIGKQTVNLKNLKCEIRGMKYTPK